MLRSRRVALRLLLISIIILVSASCSLFVRQLTPAELATYCPSPIEGTSGKYMCPYLKDGNIAAWTSKGNAASLGASIGEYAGRELGQKALEQVPLIGGFLGQKAGEAAGRTIAIKLCGGWDYIQSTSEQSFNSVEDLSLFLYVHHSGDPGFQHVLKLTCDIYPELEEGYYSSIQSASKRYQNI